MPIEITNTLSRKREPFVPLHDKQVGMYVCGPTVYNFIHVGNARPLVFFDVVRRFLEFSGYDVKHVMNYTDVDDKIIQRALEEKTTAEAITAKYIKEYETDMGLLGVQTPHVMPKVSEHIPQIIALIEKLIANKAAYVVNGEVLYSVRSFPGYGKLSGKNIDDLMSGARVEVDEKKKDPLDFSLWKPRKTESEVAWDSPWGKGRPGWHIECSALAMEYLGETFDIHGGGMDLIHPHHENEIAQSEGCTHQPFAKVWMHNNMLNLGAEKMSKSVGNIFLTRDFIEKFGAETLKFLLLSGHYRSTIDFSEKHINDTQAGLHRIYSTLQRCHAVTLLATTPGAQVSTEENTAAKFQAEFRAQWVAAMEDDFNTAKAVGLIFEYVRAVNAALDPKKPALNEGRRQLAHKFIADFKELGGVFNLFSIEPKQFLHELKLRTLKARGLAAADIEAKVQARLAAKKAKDFKKADELRAELTQLGIQLRDSAEHSEWDVF